MRISAIVLRWIFPKWERERMEHRKEVAHATALAEDLTRSLSKLNGKEIARMMEIYQRHKRE